VLGSRIRAQRAYRTSFVLDLASSLLIGLTEFGEVWVVFTNVTVLGGLDFDAVLLLFGLSNLAFSLADLVVGHVDNLPTFIRAGTLDAFYLRPLPVLAQLVTSDFTLKRLARIGVAAAALIPAALSLLLPATFLVPLIIATIATFALSLVMWWRQTVRRRGAEP